MSKLNLCTFLTLVFATSFSQAAVTVTAIESGGDVVFSMSGGSLNVSGYTKRDTSGPAFIWPSDKHFAVGPSALTTSDLYAVTMTYPTAFGTGLGFTATSGSGNLVGVLGNEVIVPDNYVSGSALGAATSTYSDQTFASRGMTPGSYTWSWASDSITLNVLSTPVTWTLQNVTTESDVSWTGTFDYDATTNTYSAINIESAVIGFPNPVDTLSTDSTLSVGCPDPATANGVTFGPDASGFVLFCMNFASPLTNSGGTINLVTGGTGWAIAFNPSVKMTGGSVTTAPTPPIITVAIDIKPGQVTNSIHTNHNNINVSPFLDDLIEVGVLGAMTSVGDPVDFDTSDINPATLAFGPGAGAIAPGTTPLFDQNVDNDGIDDAKFEFRTSASGISCGETSATLTGETTGGQPFTGTDTITTQCNATCH